ncbi:histidine kinase [Paenibacillus motobuensis]|uniref:sensor histidine kinase n=1 Tax=Paenibacillus TaxID=44249 RepID=UPI00203C6DD8|nr:MULTISPECIES: histidine kinase [Paenibacillus]MCM3041901.1 histidine kinase [Paenibacillus lutimineralis]MCM3649005.1 histidine kinase [Paenibacillus motobuensis]
MPRFFRRSISNRIFGYFMILIVISLSVVGTITYFQSSKLLDRQLERYLSQMITHAAYHTDLYLQTFDNASKTILSSSDVLKFMEMDPDDGYQYYELSQKIQSEVFDSAFIVYPQIDLIYIINQDGKAITTKDMIQSEVKDYKSYYELIEQNLPENGMGALINSASVAPEDEQYITFVRRVRGIVSHKPRGILGMKLNTREISKLWGQMDLGEQGYSFIIDAKGNFVDKPDEAEASEYMDVAIKHRLLAGDDTFTERIGGKKRMYVSKQLQAADWRMVISVPVSELRQPIMNIRYTTVIAGAVTLLVALWIAGRFGKSLVQPLKKLVRNMRLMEKGEWQMIDPGDREDEFGYLIQNYNKMLTRLSEMIEQVYEAELKSQKAELNVQRIALEQHKAEFQALQLQINPHFLYNTLETIKCYAVVQDSEEIMDMVEAMASMLRYAIQTSLTEITVVDELKHVLNYMKILQYRTQRQFELEVTIPPDLLLHKMVRLTLQPLIENVFQHAFPNGIQNHHHIGIRGYMEEGRFILAVADNGAGMSEDKLHAVREKLRLNQLAEADPQTTYHQGGLGLMNVHRRIQMVYGETYGLSSDSTVGQGTKIIMSLPSDSSIVCRYEEGTG